MENVVKGLSEQSEKFYDEISEAIKGFDIYEQNGIIIRLCQNIVTERKEYLEKTHKEHAEYGELTDILIKELSGIS